MDHCADLSLRRLASSTAGSTVVVASLCWSPKSGAPSLTRIAAFTNKHAGDLAFEDLSYGMMAQDVADRVPRVLKKHL